MATYTVKPGDNLSTIAKNQGVKVADITGYRSGNPNLIYPGEVLTINGGPSSEGQMGFTKASPVSPEVSANKLVSGVAPAYTTGSSTQAALTGVSGAVTTATQNLEQNIRSQQTAIDTQMKTQQSKIDSALTAIDAQTQPFRQKEETAGREKYKTDEMLKDQYELVSELDALLTEGNNLIRQQQEVTGLASVRNPRIQQTMEDVAARAGVIEAVINAQNTYLANAYYAIDRTVAAIAGDRQDRINYYSSVLALADERLIELTSEKRRLAQEETNMLRYKIDQAQATADYVKNLMVSPDTALALARSGVTLNDSIEQINQKLAKYDQDERIRTKINEFTSSGGKEVQDPSGVPAHLLASFTDDNGKTHYFQYAEAPKAGGSGGGMTIDDYVSTFSLSDFVSTTPQEAVKMAVVESQPPQFSAAKIGWVYTDPNTGDVWQWTGRDWKKVS